MCVHPIKLKDQDDRVPCGFCLECRSRYARSWSIRCVHEASLHERSCFLTLTYDDDHLPEYGSLVLRDLQLFMKKLRLMLNPRIRWRGKGWVQGPQPPLVKVRHYAVGEYGSANHRPHYHILVFGYCPADLVAIPSKSPYPLFRSPEVEGLWTAGLSSVGFVSFESAQYLARYVMQYVDNVKRPKKYSCEPETGELHEISKEFSVMSRRPGIGAGWYDKYGAEVHRMDSVVLEGKELMPPRYYDNKLRERDAVKWELMKLTRERKRLKEGKTFSEDKRDRMAREIILRNQLAEMERGL